MQVNTCISEMLRKRGATRAGVSRELGRSASWCGMVAAPSRSPALATVADIADALGYEVTIIDRATGERVGTIEPPRQSASAD